MGWNDWKNLNIDAETLAAIVLGMATIVVSLYGLQRWGNDWIVDIHHSLIQRDIEPRLSVVERDMRRHEEMMDKIMDRINEMENSRNRQYEELKKNQDEIKDIMSDIRDMSTRK